MNQLSKLQKLVVRIFRINVNDATVRFSVNQALREQRRQGKHEGIEQGRQEKPDCLMCPHYHKAHLHEITALEPTTEDKIPIRGARQRHITRTLQNHPGLLLHHHNKMAEQRTHSQDEPHTQIDIPRTLPPTG